MQLFPDEAKRALGISVYTMHPDIACENIFSDDSLHQLSHTASVSRLLINFVSPGWSEDAAGELVDRIEYFGISVRYSVNSYDIKGRGLIPCNRMRYDSVSLEELPFYAFLTENARFRSNGDARVGAFQFVDAVHYMATHPRCGIVSLKARNSKGFFIPSDSVSPVPLSFPVGIPMVVRSMKNISPYGFLIPRRSLDLEGTGDDLLVASHILWNGYFPAILSGSRVVFSKMDMGGSDSRAILEMNNCRFIQDTFNHRYAYSEKGANLVGVSVYTENGGPVITESYQRMNTVSYAEEDARQEVSRIQKILGL